MCGIFCEICFYGAKLTKDTEVLRRIRNRGPNCSESFEICTENGISIYFCGAVLWMQGPQLVPQPVVNDQGVLLYNGDIFDEMWDTNVSDTQSIMQKLTTNITHDLPNHIIEQLRLLKGPFAIMYYDRNRNELYFTRDKIGRSSLLFHKSENSIVISNVLGRDYSCVEIPATHIYKLNLNTKEIVIQPWYSNHSTETLSLDIWLKQLVILQSLPDDAFEFDFDEEDLSDKDNVIDFIESVAKKMESKLSIMKTLLEHFLIKDTVLEVCKLLEKSVELRLNRQPNKCKDCLYTHAINCEHCTVGVLFSGGLDCTILALLADKYLPKNQSIDLINVAFRKDDQSSYEVPDRITGRQSLQELKRMCPSRKWVFIEVNIEREEIYEFQEGTIGDLVYPRQTILDESLGTALWFAARGVDSISSSTSRVLLLGSGADELFGGYIRHRNALKRHGWQGLSKELQLDWKRISFRNLARDNRVICDHGRQPRMPYLDEDFINYILRLKPWLRCFPSDHLGIGLGDKLMLRLVAIHLGLTDAVVFPKRALQFGSRIANKKEKGSDISRTFMKNKYMST